MNRRILFRGKCDPQSKYAGEWVYGGCVQCENGDTLIISAQTDTCTSTYHVIPDSVGQLVCQTHVTEKHAMQDIYEGDILKGFQPYERGMHMGYVYWDKFAQRFKLHTANHYLEDLVVFTIVDVIGNIHDNPEIINLNI